MDRHLRRRPGIRRRASAHREPPRIDSLLDTRFVAQLLGVLAALGLFGATLSFTVDLFVAPWRLFTSDAEESLHLLASVIGLIGAYRLARGLPRARAVVLGGLGVNLAVTLMFSARTLGRPETLVPVLTWLSLAALTLAARRPPALKTAEPWPMSIPIASGIQLSDQAPAQSSTPARVPPPLP